MLLHLLASCDDDDDNDAYCFEPLQDSNDNITIFPDSTRLR